MTIARTVFTPTIIAVTALLLIGVLSASPAAAGDTAPALVITTMEDTAPAPAPLMENAASAEATAAPAETAKTKSGFPQLDTSTYSSQVFWLAISFALLYLLMSRLALPRITEVLDMRQTQINANLDRAAQLSQDAQTAKEGFESLLAQAQDTAQGIVAAVEQAASERASAESARFADHARTRVATAENNIAAAKAQALNALADIAADVAADMVNKVGKTHLSKADALAAVQAQMNKAA